MKFTLPLVAFLATLSIVCATTDLHLQKRFITCDSILAVKVCDKFRNIGNKIQVTATEIETYVTDAYNKGITKAEEIKNYVENELETRILSKSCEELTGKVFCEKLDTISTYLKKKSDELKPLIAKAILAGKEKTFEIAAQVEDYIKNDLMKKRCVDILTQVDCDKIDRIGNALKLKAQEIKEALVASVLKGYTHVRDTITTTFTNMKKAAEKFMCEDLLNPDVCVSIRDYANRLRIGMPKMMNAVRSAIVMGYKGTKGFLTVVYKITDAFIDCEHFLSHENCEKIKSTAAKVGAKISEINVAIRDAVAKGITEAEKIYKSVSGFLKEKFGRKRRSLAEKLNLKEQLQKYKELLKVQVAKADEYIKNVIKGLLEKYNEVDAKVTELIEKAITEGKVRYGQIKKYIEELVAKHKAGKSISKRDTSKLREMLKKALGKATGLTATMIKTLLNYSNEKLQSIKRTVQSIIDRVIGSTDNKRDTEREEENQIADAKIQSEFADIAAKLSNDVDRLVDEIADETDSLIRDVINSEKKVNKRFLDVDLKDLNLAEYVTEVLKRQIGNLKEKINNKSADLLKNIKEALSKAGSKITDVKKVVIEQINEMIRDFEQGPNRRGKKQGL